MTEIDTLPVPQTRVLRRLLMQPMNQAALADYLFLEAWERHPSDNAGAALRVGQIRRANPALAAEIRDEIKAEILAELKAHRFAAIS
jgi:hypothetical protein